MNELMKEAASTSVTHWTATAPLVLFLVFFVGVVVWTYTQAPKQSPELE